MLNELILAMALTSTQPIADISYYNLNNDYGNISINLTNYDAQDNNALIINLDTGDVVAAHLSIGDAAEHTYTIDYSQIWTHSEIHHLSDYIQWFYHDSQESIGFDWNGFNLDFPFTPVMYNSLWSEIYLECFFAVPTRVPGIIQDVSGYSEIQIDFDTGRSMLFNEDWYDPISFISLDTSYLVIKTNEIFDGNNNKITPSKLDLFVKYSDIGIRNDAVDIYGSYTDFIYGNLEELLDTIDNLTLENERLTENNEFLRAENDSLNSKHALSNVFDIIRASFNGIVDFLEIELLPNLTIGTIIFIPVVIGVIFFILKALVL